MGHIRALGTILKVGKEEAQMMVDTGADRSCLSEKFYEYNKGMLGPLTHYSGERLKVIGITREITIKWEGQEMSGVKFIVLPSSGGYDGILGMDLMPALNINIDTSQKTIRKELYKKEIRLLEDIKIDSQTEMITTIHVDDWHSPLTVFEPDGKNMPEGIRAVATLSASNNIVLKLQNIGESQVKLQHGWKIGDIEIAEISKTIPNDGPKPEIPKELNKHQRKEMEILLEEYRDIFATCDTDRGRTDYIQHKIKTTGEPVKQTFRRQPPERRKIEQEQVKEMLKSEAIEESQSPWSSPVVLVKKKDNTYRFCVDYRKLNDVTVKDAQPLPRIDDTLESLYGARWFTTLDLQSGYWQVPLNSDDKEKTAFVTGDGNLY